MAYKTDRNTILRDVSRLMTADFNGESWACPDAYFATAYPIYEGYKVKKEQTIPDVKPPLHQALANYKTYELPTGVKRGKRDEWREDSPQVITFTRGDYSFTVNADYYDFLMSLYPKAQAKVCIDGYRIAPVELHSEGALVAVIMPLNR